MRASPAPAAPASAAAPRRGRRPRERARMPRQRLLSLVRRLLLPRRLAPLLLVMLLRLSGGCLFLIPAEAAGATAAAQATATRRGAAAAVVVIRGRDRPAGLGAASRNIEGEVASREPFLSSLSSLGGWRWWQGRGGGVGGGRLQGGGAVVAVAADVDVEADDGRFRRPQRQRRYRRSQALLDRALSLRGGGAEEDPRPTLPPLPSSSSKTNADGYALLEDTTVFRGWRNVVERRVRYPSGNLVNFHLTEQAGASNRAVLVLCWDRSSKTCTLVREYMPSRHRLVCGLAAGVVEENDEGQSSSSLAHAAVEESARRELAEECRLEGGTWFALTPPHGTVMDKYCTTRLHAYLVVDAAPLHEDNKNDARRDEAEEGMQVLSGITLEQLKEWIRDGELTVVGAWGALLAMDKLRSLGEAP